MRILSPIVPPPAALMQVLDAEIAAAGAYDHQSSVTSRSGARAYFFRRRCQSNGGSSTCSATAISQRRLCREGAPLGQGSRASLLVDLPRDEMALLIELVVHLGVN